MKKVISEVFFDGVSQMANQNNKIVKTMNGIRLHDVPKYWFPANLDHGFRADTRLFANTSAFSTGKN